MSVRYELRSIGVYDREAARVVLPTDPAWLDYHDVFLAQGGIPDPMPAPAPPSLDQVRAARASAVEEIAAHQRRIVTTPSSPSEMASWTEKLRQARAYVAGIDSTAPMLALEAQHRGVTTQDIVSRILNNATQFSQAEAAIAGNSGRHKDALAALTDIGQLLAYDITTGWPFWPAAPSAVQPT